MKPTNTAQPGVGFTTPDLQSADAFRQILDAMARPGQIRSVAGIDTAPAPLHLATAIALLTLADMDTPLWLDEPFRNEAVFAFLRFHCGMPITHDRAAAAFAVIAAPGRVGSLGAFNQGTAEYPDRSTTLIVQIEALAKDGPQVLTGPGIKTRQAFGITPDHQPLWLDAIANHGRFPLGVDMIFAAPNAIACLPRSTAVTFEEIA